MKRILSILSSTKLMIILLLIFAFSIACATFIEKGYGTEAARKIVYNAKWFEFILLLGAINIIFVTVNRQLYRKEKLTLLIFHTAFILIIAGAGITRYFGKEGYMNIREGNSESTWYSSNTQIGLVIKSDSSIYSKSYPVLFSGVSKNRFKRSFRFNDHKISMKLSGFIPKAEKYIKPDPEGLPIIEIITNTGKGEVNFFLKPGQFFKVFQTVFSFNSTDLTEFKSGTINLFSKGNSLFFVAPEQVILTEMPGDLKISVLPGQQHEVKHGALYRMGDMPFVISGFTGAGKIAVRTASSQTENPISAVLIDLTFDGKTQSTFLTGNRDEVGQFTFVTGNKNIYVNLFYGAIKRKLPFDLNLTDFILERYPGSASPSWYESKVKLIDNSRKVEFEHRIYMNHILKYRGYRFYQSSYDTDEKGTQLAVNKDGTGTVITYLGYLFMALGMILSLLNRNSRFHMASKPVASKISAVFILFFMINLSSRGNDSLEIKKLPVIKKDYAEKFGQLLIQDNGGRIEPVNTMASEVLRKIARKESYKGQSPDQVILGMLVYPEIWQEEPIIRINHPGLQRILEQDTKYASFNNFFSNDHYRSYLLLPYVEEAYRKPPAHRSKFENEVIRTDERINICYQLYIGDILNMFPAPHDSTNTWHSSLDAGKYFTGEDSAFTLHILPFCFQEIRNSMKTGEWKGPDELVQAINLFQQYHGEKVIPSSTHIKAELFFNKAEIFTRITKIYLVFGLILLLIQFIHIFVPRFNIKWFFIPAFALIILAFVMHSCGLGLRWYISGHAPWSNGYEALIFIAWSTVLAGLIFSRKAGIALSSTAVLASLILQTAHLSWMDPQITNLVPVLKSYWLIVHVAVITASYGFLGLAALIAAINLLLLTFQSNKNHDHLENQISQISRVIEMSLIAGLYLLSIGTFLGGVWANESWGRYWAWDPKETWALITVIVYAIILHLRLILGFGGRVIFNIMALVGFASVIMTYFGVNYYLSGLHSYAGGESLSVPPAVYWSAIIVLLLSSGAEINQYRLGKYLRKKR
jgi:cytochrome c-type biogenesis protein CcsB